MNKLYSLLLAPVMVFASEGGKLPEGFKFESFRDGRRNPIISQLARYEDCNGDEKCIEALRDLEGSVLVTISESKIQVENRSKDAHINLHNNTVSSVHNGSVTLHKGK